MMRLPFRVQIMRTSFFLCRWLALVVLLCVPVAPGRADVVSLTVGINVTCPYGLMA
jgi:hypothetical protein